MIRFSLLLLVLLLLSPVFAERTVEFRSLTDEPVVGGILYYREFSGRIDPLFFGPSGMTEEVFTSDANGRVSFDKPRSSRMPSAFGSDYALFLAGGYTAQLISLQDLQNQIYLRPSSYCKLKLLLPDGSPAAGATFIATANGKTHQLNNPFTGVSTACFNVTADKDGVVTVPSIRRAIEKNSSTDVRIDGIAYLDGFVNEDIVLQSLGKEVTATLRPAQQVQGVVVDLAGNAITKASIRCAEYLLPAAQSDTQGRFRFSNLPVTVPPFQAGGRAYDGTLNLYIDAPGYARQGIKLLPNATKVDNYRITLEPLVTVSGKLIDPVSKEQTTNSRKVGFYILVRHSLGEYSDGHINSTLFVTEQNGTFSAQIPRQSCLEVNNGMSIGTRTPFIAGDYQPGDVIMLSAASR